MDSIHFYNGRITPINLKFNYKQMLWNEPTLEFLAICILAISYMHAHAHTHTEIGCKYFGRSFFKSIRMKNIKKWNMLEWSAIHEWVIGEWWVTFLYDFKMFNTNFSQVKISSLEWKCNFLKWDMYLAQVRSWWNLNYLHNFIEKLGIVNYLYFLMTTRW